MGCDKTRYHYLTLPFTGSAYIETNSVVKPPKFCHIERTGGEIFIWIGKTHIILTPRNWCGEPKDDPYKGGVPNADDCEPFHGRK